MCNINYISGTFSSQRIKLHINGHARMYNLDVKVTTVPGEALDKTWLYLFAASVALGKQILI